MPNDLPLKNKLPVWLKYFILSIPVIFACFQVHGLDNDFYFLYPTGEYIINNGFPHTDILSMHSSMKIMVQQWLNSVIFYFVYSHLGKIGIIALVYVCYAAICALSYRLTLTITKNELLSAISSAIGSTVLYYFFIYSRPQLFTYIVLLSSVLLLEKHAQTKKKLYLVAIPVLSLALVNLHAAMWPLLPVLMLPYIAASIPVHIKTIKKEPCGDLLSLFIAFALSIAAGFLNPYGTENTLYLATAFNQKTISSMIVEMKPLSWGVVTGIEALFAIIFLMAVITLVLKKRSVSVRFFLLFFGTVAIGIVHVKGMAYFLLFGIPAFSYLLKDWEIKQTNTKNNGRYVSGVVIALLILAPACAYLHFKNSKYERSSAEYYTRLDEAISLIGDSNEVTLFANFNDGQYLEFRGYHPYIDGRAELYLAINNNEFNYLDEYYSIVTASQYYRTFVDKYGFDYLIVNRNANKYLYVSLVNDEDFEHAYESGDVNLFIRKTGV